MLQVSANESKLEIITREGRSVDSEHSALSEKDVYHGGAVCVQGLLCIGASIVGFCNTLYRKL